MLQRVTRMAAVFIALSFFGGCVAEKQLSTAAVSDVVAAVTVTNEELIEISRQMREEGDKQAKVAASGGKYAKRLARLTDRFKNEDGLSLNFKVYLTQEVNANATADGSIRVYSGLMDMMTDNELLFVIGHEIGHVAGGDSLAKIRVAYLSSGAIKGAASVSSAANTMLTATQLGALLHTVLNAQFSQKQESEADAYSYRLMKKYKLDRKAAVSALQKLGGGKARLTSTHPDSADRIKAIQAMINADVKK